jgi:hypothetical protein
VMHQWHPALSSSKHMSLLEFIDSTLLTAGDESPFLWNGSRVDVDGHLRGDAVSGGGDGGDDWGLNALELEEQVVAANAR